MIFLDNSDALYSQKKIIKIKYMKYLYFIFRNIDNI